MLRRLLLFTGIEGQNAARQIGDETGEAASLRRHLLGDLHNFSCCGECRRNGNISIGPHEDETSNTGRSRERGWQANGEETNKNLIVVDTE